MLFKLFLLFINPITIGSFIYLYIFIKYCLFIDYTAILLICTFSMDSISYLFMDLDFPVTVSSIPPLLINSNSPKNKIIEDINNNPSIINLELKLRDNLQLMAEGGIKDILVERFNTPKENLIKNYGILNYETNAFIPILSFKLREGLKLINLGAFLLKRPGIYKFSSLKDPRIYYIGSSLNIYTRVKRHFFNINSEEFRNFNASPKFYNWVRSHSWADLQLDILVFTNNYKNYYESSKDLKLEGSKENCRNLINADRLILNNITALDNLIIEQVFLSSEPLSLNLSSYAGSKLNTFVSNETKEKQSKAMYGENHYSKTKKSLSSEQWSIIRSAAKDAWANELPSSPRRNAISILHGTSVRILDENKNLIIEFPSMLQASKYLDCNRKTIKTYIDTGGGFNSKKGLIFIESVNIQSRNRAIDIYDLDKNLIQTVYSLRETCRIYDIPIGTIDTYINKDRVYNNQFYFKDHQI